MTKHSKTLVKIYLAFGQSEWQWSMLDKAGIDHSRVAPYTSHLYYENTGTGNVLTDKFVKDYMSGKLP